MDYITEIIELVKQIEDITLLKYLYALLSNW